MGRSPSQWQYGRAELVERPVVGWSGLPGCSAVGDWHDVHGASVLPRSVCGLSLRSRCMMRKTVRRDGNWLRSTCPDARGITVDVVVLMTGHGVWPLAGGDCSRRGFSVRPFGRDSVSRPRTSAMIFGTPNVVWSEAARRRRLILPCRQTAHKEATATRRIALPLFPGCRVRAWRLFSAAEELDDGATSGWSASPARRPAACSAAAWRLAEVHVRGSGASVLTGGGILSSAVSGQVGFHLMIFPRRRPDFLH